MLSSVEVVERKGVGHPDTLANALANEVSRRYSAYFLENFGGVPRHSFDKLVLTGAVSHLTFGKGELVSPIACHLFGKMSLDSPDVTSSIRDFVLGGFRAVAEVAVPGLAHHPLEVQIHTNAGVGAEHPSWYYNPRHTHDLDRLGVLYEANDTAVVFGHAVPSSLERLVIACEHWISSEETQHRFGTGTDVKVLMRREGESLHAHVAVPFIASKVENSSDYRERLSALRDELLTQLQVLCVPGLKLANLQINTKDRQGTGYLTLAGSALDKGDQGAVGRGNGFSGVISMNRPQSVESFAGKNPVRSAGRLYPYVCERLSRELYSQTRRDVSIGLQSGNGLPLANPSSIFAVDRDGRCDVIQVGDVGGMISDALAAVMMPSELNLDLRGRLGVNHVPIVD